MGKDKPLISVIVPVYNVEEYLNKCVESIVNQTYNNLEIILVDDGSPDLCPQICDEWAKKDSRIKVIHKENGGLSSARNAGLDNCNGEYVGFVDSDDWIDNKFFETLYKGMETEGVDISVVGVWRVYSDRRVNVTEMYKEKVFSKEEVIYSYLYFENNLTGGVADKLFKVKLFTDIRFPLGITSEDRYAWALLCDKIDKLYFNPVPLYYYVMREGSICNSGLNKNTFDVIKITDMICEYLNTTGFEDKKALSFFKMKAYLDTLYKLLIIDGSKSMIQEYMRKTRSYFGDVMTNRRVSMSVKVKYMCYCYMPRTYENIKKIIKR